MRSARECPAYVHKRIALQATVDLINRHGWDALGDIGFEESYALVEKALHDRCNGRLVLFYTHTNELHRLSHNVKEYE